jgi:hypothetical protein
LEKPRTEAILSILKYAASSETVSQWFLTKEKAQQFDFIVGLFLLFRPNTFY